MSFRNPTVTEETRQTKAAMFKRAFIHSVFQTRARSFGMVENLLEESKASVHLNHLWDGGGLGGLGGARGRWGGWLGPRQSVNPCSDRPGGEGRRDRQAQTRSYPVFSG